MDLDTHGSNPPVVMQAGLAPIVVLNGRAYVMDGYPHLFPGRPKDQIDPARPSDGTVRDVDPRREP
jgi:hypothetical protein